MSKNGFSLTLIGLVVAVLGIVAPIAWDFWSSNSELTLTKDRTATIFEDKADIKNLSIFYNGREINTLSKTFFELKNTGRRPITDNDFVSNPVVVLHDGDVLEVEVDSSMPDNITKHVSSKGSVVQLEFKLLNPGDYIKFSVVTNSTSPQFSARARIKGVNELRFIEGENRIHVNSEIKFHVYVVGGFSLFFVVIGLGLVSVRPKLKKQLALVSRGEIPIHPGESVGVVLGYIDVDLGMLTRRKKDRLRRLVPVDAEFLSERDAKNIVNEVRYILGNESPITSAIFSLILAGYGWWYVFKSLFI